MKKILNEPLIRTHSGFKALVAWSGLLITISVGAYYSSRRMPVTADEWCDFASALASAFWFNHLSLFSGIVLCWVALFVLNVAEPIQHLFGRRVIVPRRHIADLRRLKLLGYLAAVGFLGALLMFVPIINPHGISSLAKVLNILGLVTIAVGLMSNLGFRGRGFEDYTASVPFHFDRCTFDVASTAPTSAEVKSALDVAAKSVRPAVDISRVLKPLEQLLTTPTGTIRLHVNTTAAYDHAFQEMFENGFGEDGAIDSPVVLASDAEYPNIERHLDAYAKSKQPIILAKAAIRELLWEGASDERVVNAYVAEATRHKNTRVQVVALCHVHHASGRDLPLTKIVNELERRDLWSPKAGFLLIDGAQAVGNIDIDNTMWDRCDFYAFCGHKWLLAKPSIGALYTKRDPMGRADWRTVPLPGGLSQADDPNEKYGSTVNIDSRISLQTSVARMLSVGLAKIADHNAQLAALFREKLPLAEVNVFPVGIPNGGIVTVVGETMVIDALAKHLTSCYGKLTTFGPDIVPHESKSAMRFCFHCFHTRDDVYSLVEEISRLPV